MAPGLAVSERKQRTDRGKGGGGTVVVKALKNFGVFGKANPDGQKWAAACVVNLGKVKECREEMVREGVLEALRKVLDNSNSVKNDIECVLGVVGAVMEMGRKPWFDERRRLVDLKVQIVVKEVSEPFGRRACEPLLLN